MSLLKRFGCPHYFEKFYEAIDVYEQVGNPLWPRYLGPFEEEWLCVRGCGKRKITSLGRIPFGYVGHNEVVLNGHLYGPTINRRKRGVLAA